MKRWFWLLDALVVVGFVGFGRENHGFATDWVETLTVALPFLLALSVGTAVVIMFMDPTGWPAGFVVSAATVVGGLLLRSFVFNDTTAAIFILVTAAWMTGWMVGWRLLAAMVTRFAQQRGVSNVA